MPDRQAIQSLVVFRVVYLSVSKKILTQNSMIFGIYIHDYNIPHNNRYYPPITAISDNDKHRVVGKADVFILKNFGFHYFNVELLLLLLVHQN